MAVVLEKLAANFSLIAYLSAVSLLSAYLLKLLTVAIW